MWFLSTRDLSVVAPRDAPVPLYVRQAVAATRTDPQRDSEPQTVRPFADVRITIWPVEADEREPCIAVLLEHLRARRPELLFNRYRLSPRELDVVRLMLSGLDVETVAGRLELSATTVRDYFKRALAKTGAKNRLHMAALLLGFDADRAPERTR